MDTTTLMGIYAIIVFMVVFAFVLVKIIFAIIDKDDRDK